MKINKEIENLQKRIDRLDVDAMKQKLKDLQLQKGAIEIIMPTELYAMEYEDVYIDLDKLDKLCKLDRLSSSDQDYQDIHEEIDYYEKCFVKLVIQLVIALQSEGLKKWSSSNNLKEYQFKHIQRIIKDSYIPEQQEQSLLERYNSDNRAALMTKIKPLNDDDEYIQLFVIIIYIIALEIVQNRQLLKENVSKKQNTLELVFKDRKIVTYTHQELLNRINKIYLSKSELNQLSKLLWIRWNDDVYRVTFKVLEYLYTLLQRRATLNT